MNYPIAAKICRSTVVFAVVVFAAARLLAGPIEPVVEKNPNLNTPEGTPWSLRLALYGWMQSLNGTIGVRGIESEVDVPFSDVLKKLNFGAMGVAELRFKRWSVTADM